MLQRALRVVAFPALSFGAVFTLILRIHQGHDELSTSLLVLVPFTVLLMVLERVIPYANQWNIPKDDVPVDIAYLVTNSILQPFMSMVALVVYLPLAAGLAATLDCCWPASWPLSLQCAWALIVKEFFHYWLHRVTHESDSILWRCHAIHHSSERLYWLNSMRLHPANMFFDIIIGIGPLVIVGAGRPVLFLVGLTIILIGSLAHANVDFKLGPLNRVFSMPELHRWHHSRDKQVSNHNYGAVLSIWDVVFGTWYLPDSQVEPHAIGLVDRAPFPKTFTRQLTHPFLARLTPALASRHGRDNRWRAAPPDL